MSQNPHVNALIPVQPTDTSAAIVCHCFQIPERTILAAIRRGAGSVPEVLAAVKIAGGCGACACRVERMLQGLPASAFQCDGSALCCGCEALAGMTND